MFSLPYPVHKGLFLSGVDNGVMSYCISINFLYNDVLQFTAIGDRALKTLSIASPA